MFCLQTSTSFLCFFFQCIASGNPIPQVVWHIYDSLPIPDHISRYRIGDYVTRDSLLVSYVNISSVLPEGKHDDDVLISTNSIYFISFLALQTAEFTPARRRMTSPVCGTRLASMCNYFQLFLFLNTLIIISSSFSSSSFGKPSVRRMSNMTAVAGESISITCPVGGYPIDVIIWERGSNNHSFFLLNLKLNKLLFNFAQRASACRTTTGRRSFPMGR